MSFGKIGSDLAIAAPRTAFPGVIAFAADKLVSSIPAAARIFTYIPKGGTPFCLAVNTFRKVCSYALNLQRPVRDDNTTERAVRNATFLILGGMIFTHISPYIKIGAFKLGEISGKDAVKWVLLIAAVEAGIDYLSSSATSNSHRKHKRHGHHHKGHASGSRRSTSAERKHGGSEEGRKSIKRHSHSQQQQQTSSSASVADDNVDPNVPAAPGLGSNTLGRANQPTSSSAFKINRRQESSLVKHKAEERARNIAAGRVDASQSVKKDFEGKGALGYRSGSDDDEGSGSDYSQGSQRSSSGNESEGEPSPKAINRAASRQNPPSSHNSSAKTDEHEEGVGVGSGEMATNPEAEGSAPPAAPEDLSSTEAPPAPPAEDSSEGGAPPPPPSMGEATLGRLNAPIELNSPPKLVIKKKKKTEEGSEASRSASVPKGSSADRGDFALQAKQKADARAAKLASGEQKPIEVIKREIPRLEAPKVQLKSRAAGKAAGKKK